MVKCFIVGAFTFKIRLSLFDGGVFYIDYPREFFFQFFKRAEQVEGLDKALGLFSN